ncbi:hypothetical protein KUTeg_007688 [Tegillarca granosa]|uniref:SH2 domain-containing protein n=1 Tax=Tegillarca granosa TaxID=220873 RepID=A0ABQ9FIH4_TEGGR|nr:hypothetical protein KUTeg_007688 [Tegillarca granosa]
MNSSGRTPFKLFEGFLQHKGKDHQNYTDLWLVLLDSVIYVFTDSTIGKDTHIGKLTIDQYTEVHKRGGDHKSGYEFELFTGNRQTRKRNEFKSSKKFIMEVWRGYLEGLAVGTVPNDLDLLPNQVSQIKCDIDFFLKRPRFNQYLRYGNFRNSRNRMSPADGGINRHRFTDDHDFVSDQTPRLKRYVLNVYYLIIFEFCFLIHSWFFENCSRQQAERILTIGKDFGNTLMRLSSTHKDHETYVISIMFRKETRQVLLRKSRFEHFEVLPVDNGYKLNVENQMYRKKLYSTFMLMQNTFRIYTTIQQFELPAKEHVN